MLLGNFQLVQSPLAVWTLWKNLIYICQKAWNLSEKSLTNLDIYFVFFAKQLGVGKISGRKALQSGYSVVVGTFETPITRYTSQHPSKSHEIPSESRSTMAPSIKNGFGEVPPTIPSPFTMGAIVLPSTNVTKLTLEAAFQHVLHQEESLRGTFLWVFQHVPVHIPFRLVLAAILVLPPFLLK